MKKGYGKDALDKEKRSVCKYSIPAPQCHNFVSCLSTFKLIQPRNDSKEAHVVVVLTLRFPNEFF